MAKTASLNATSRPGARCPEGEPGPALPSGARAVASERTQPTTEAAHPLLVGDGITGASSMRVGARTAAGGSRYWEGLRRTLLHRRYNRAAARICQPSHAVDTDRSPLLAALA